MSSFSPATWHVQDWLLAVEALASRTHPDEQSAAAEGRWRLIDTLCEGCGIDPTEYVFAIDDEWALRADVPADEAWGSDSGGADEAGESAASEGDAAAKSDASEVDSAVASDDDIDPAAEDSGAADRSAAAITDRLDGDDWAELAAALSAFANRETSTPRTRRAAELAEAIDRAGLSTPTPNGDAGSLQSNSSQ
jgi:hypothetical protein